MLVGIVPVIWLCLSLRSSNDCRLLILLGIDPETFALSSRRCRKLIFSKNDRGTFIGPSICIDCGAMSSFHRSSIRLRSKLRTALSTGLPNIRYSMRSCIINPPIRFPSRSMKRSRGAVGSSSITRRLLCERCTDFRCTSVSTHLNEMSRRPIPDQFAFVTHGLLGTHASESMSAWSLKHYASAGPTSPNRLASLSSR